MKTERRHKLETNELADSLSHGIDSVKPYVRTIVGLLIALVVLAFAYAFVSRHAAAKAREGWDEYFQAFNELSQSNRFSREKFDDLIDKYPGTPAAWWSRTVVGDISLNEGANLLYTNKAEARDKLHSAINDYETVLKEATESAVLERATFGLGRAHESLGELKEAGDAYAALVKKWPSSALEQVARKRADDLNRQDTKQFYDWFDKQNPGTSMLKEPGKPGEKPGFDLDILDMPKTKSLFPDDRKVDEPGQPELPETPADSPSSDESPATAPDSKGEAPAEPDASGKP